MLPASLVLLAALCSRAAANEVVMGASTTISTPVLSYGYAIEAADLTGNGWPDLALADRDSDSVAWYNNSDGVFDGSEVVLADALLEYALDVTAADLDLDGDLDLLSVSKFNDSVQWYENRAQHDISGPRFLFGALGPAAVAAGDVNGDGFVDIVYVADDGDEVAYFPALDGTLRYGGSVTIGTSINGPEYLQVADMDGDDDLDVVVTTATDDTVLVYENTDGEGAFSLLHTVSSIDGASGVRVGDTDGDGDLDVVVAARIGDELWHFVNDGTGALDAGTIIATADYPVGVELADVDLDGDLDVAYVALNDDQLAWVANDGAGGFAARPETVVFQTSTYNSPRDVKASDLDQDGDVDLVVGARNGVHWFEIQTVPIVDSDAAAAPVGVPGDSEVALSWPAVYDNGAQVTTYVVSDGSSSQNVTGAPAATSLTFTGLTNGESASFRVRAINSRGPSGWTAASAAVLPATVPDAPTGLAVTPGDAFVFVEWAEPADDGGSPVTLYTVWNGAEARNTTATNITFDGLTNDVAYTFYVFARNEQGAGPHSADSAAATPRFPPDAPENVTATAGDQQCAVAWDAPADNGVAITRYTVTANTGEVETVTGGVTAAAFASLTNGVSYNFTVVATSAMGDSPRSQASASVVPASLPSPPESVDVAAGDGSLVVSWAAADDNGATITEYVVTVGAQTQTTNSLSSTFNSMTNGRIANATVESFNYIGGSGASTRSDSVIIGSPAPPTGLSAVPGNASATVFWAAGGTADNGAAVTQFTVSTSDGSHSAVVLGAGQTNATLTGLTNGNTYVFDVRAHNARGRGAAGSTSTGTTAGAPEAPADVAAVPGNAQADVSWTAPADNGAAVTGYSVSDGSSTQTASGTSLTFTGLTNLEPVTFTVAAHNARGTGPDSAASASITPFDPTARPQPPTGVRGARERAAVVVSWTAPYDGGGQITRYTVETDAGDSQAVTGAPAATNLTFTGLTPWLQYRFTVTAENYVGAGNASEASGRVAPTTAMFEAQADLQTGLTVPTAVAKGDPDGDGVEDVLVVATDFLGWYVVDSGAAHTIDTTERPAAAVFADVDQDGDDDVVAVSTNGDSVVWYINAGAGDFGSAQTIASDANGAAAVAAADLDADGDLDLVVANSVADTLVWYANANGAGVFDAAVTIASGLGGAAGVAAADLSGDGVADVVVTAADDDDVLYYRNSGTGSSFSLAQTVDAAANGARAVALADLDGNGFADIVVAAELADQVLWYANSDSGGSFAAGEVVTAAQDAPEALAAADMDLDGDVDLVVVSSGDGTVAWYENTAAAGTWVQRTVAVAAGSGAAAVAVPDADGDGDFDVVVGNGADGSVSWWRSVELPSAPSAVEGAFGARQVALTWAAPDDGGGEILEYIVEESYTGTNMSVPHPNATVVGLTPWVHYRFSVYARNRVGLSPASEPSGYFVPTTALFENTTSPVFLSGAPPVALAAGDFDGDGDVDVAVASAGGGVAWLNNTDDGDLSRAVNVSSSARGASALAVADVDGDGADDLVLASADDDAVRWFAGPGLAAETLVTTAAVGASAVAVGDVDGDGAADVVVGSAGDATLAWYTAGGALGGTIDGGGATDVAAVAVADFDGDGADDVAFASASTTVAVYLAAADFGGGAAVLSGGGVADAGAGLAAADVDGDGDADLLAASAWFENDGSGGFTAHAIATAVAGASGLAAADVDGDGDVDVLVASASGGVDWLENEDGAGDFVLSSAPASPVAAQVVAAADLNGDGHPDCVSASPAGRVEWRRAYGVPHAPYDIIADVGVNEVNMSWSAPYDFGRAITRYLVWESVTGANLTVEGSPPTPALRFPGLTAGVHYSFTVAAQNAVGQGHVSAATDALRVEAVPKEYVTLDASYFEDTTVNRQLWPHLNFNSPWYNVITGAQGSPDGHSEIWIKVRLGVLEGQVDNITLAELHMFGGSIGHEEQFDVFAAEPGWNETGLVWDNRPGLDGYLFSGTHAALEWSVFDVTDVLKEQYNATEELNLVIQPASDEVWTCHWASRESLDPPYLQLTYN